VAPPGKINWKETGKEWLALLLLHCVFLAVATVTAGVLLEVTLDHFGANLWPFAPGIAFVALLTGYFVVSQGQSRRAAAWTWTVGVVWFSVGIYDAAWGWDPAWSLEKSRLAYVIVDLFGPADKCSASECVGVGFFTMPFTATVLYSIGAYIKIRRLAKT
jgi:hypothetical protein